MAEDLATMNEKQRAKEFKAVAKGIRSKDLAVKEPALQKIYANRAYLFEGDCLKPLFETLIPKKGAYEPCLANIIAIEKIFSTYNPAELSQLFKGILQTSEGNNSLSIFQTLSNLISYKEDVKLPKPKKGEPQEIVIPPENEQVVTIRNKAILSLNIYFKAIDLGNDIELKQAAITSIPNLLSNQMAALNLTLSNMSKDEITKLRSIDETKLILSTITRCLQFCKSSEYVTQFIYLQWVPLMTSFLSEESLYLPTLQVIKEASLNKYVIQLISDTNFLSTLIPVIESVTQKMEAFNVPKEVVPVDPKAKAPPPKKDDKKGKGAAEAPAADAGADALKDSKIYLVACARIFGEILKLCFEDRTVVPDEESSIRVASALNKLIKNSAVPEICRANENSKEDGVGTVISDTLNHLCAGLGSLAAISESIRSSVCTSISDLVKVLVDTLQNSASIIGYDASSPQSEITDKLKLDLSRLRAYLEKSILSLVTSHSSNLGSISDNLACNYWTSSSLYTTHLINVESYLSSFIDMATQTADIDLSDRAMRLTAFFVYTLKDKASIPALFKFDAAFVSKLSIISHSRATTTANGLKLQFESNVENGLSNNSYLNHSESENLISISSDHALYYSLLILVSILEVSPDIINAFCNKDRIVTLREILYYSGPTVVPKTLTHAEYKVDLRNAWNYNWSFDLDNNSPQNHSPDKHFLRPLIIDVLTKICESDKVFRTFEGSVPAAPAKEVFKSASKTNDAVMTVIKFSSDVVVSILLAHVNVVINRSNDRLMLEKQPSTYWDGKFNYWTTEINQLLKSSLKFMASVSKCGSIGSYAILESISESIKSVASVSGSEDKFLLSPLEWLRTVGVTDIESLAFTRSLYFSDFFHLDEAASCLNSVLNNKNSWPYITLILSLLVIVSDDLVHSSISSLAIDALGSFCEDKSFEANCQPVVCDILSAVLLSFGGATILSGYFGKFGRLHIENPELNAVGVSFLMYILSRGINREKFWTEFKELNASPPPVIDPKTGKPVAKKEEKKKEEKKAPAGKDAKGTAPALIIVEEIKFNIEPEDPHIDPNRGPSKEFWLKVVDNYANDSYNVISQSSGLLSAVHACVPELSTYLIDCGVDINYCEANGRNALIFAFIFNDALVADKLVKTNAELDAVDIYGNPCIKYAFCSLDEASFSQIYQDNLNSYLVVPRNFISGNIYFGSNALFSILQSTNVDINVPDSAGNFPVHYALGLCESELYIAGSSLTLRNNAYRNDWSEVELSMRNLVGMNANVNLCNKNGISPLHFAAVKGDVKLAQYLLSTNAKPNVLDCFGYLPLHYVCQCCPEGGLDLFDVLFEATINRPIESFSFSDIRIGKSKEEKVAIDIEDAFNSIFGSELNPATSLSSIRSSAISILNILSYQGFTLIHMCLSKELDCYIKDASLFSDNKFDRINLALHIIKLAERENCLSSLMSNSSSNDRAFTLLHAAAVLLKGVSPQETLPEKQTKVRKQSKRVTEADKLNRNKELHARRLFVNEEARLVDVILEYLINSSNASNLDCRRPINLFKHSAADWSPLHAAIANDNSALCQTLIDKYPISHDIVMFTAALPQISIETIKVIINAVCQSKELDSFKLNSFVSYESDSIVGQVAGVQVTNTTPLHLAVKLNNCNFIRVACSKLQFNVNAHLNSPSSSDDIFIPTAFVNACYPANNGDNTLATHFESAFDRMDLLEHFCSNLIDGRKVNCIEYAVYTKDLYLLRLFVNYRQNDVLQVVLNESNRSSSLLLQLELEQIDFVNRQKPESTIQNAPNDIDNDCNEGDQVISTTAVPLAPVSAEIIEACDKNCQVLQILLPLVNDSNLLASCAHAHRCFFDNIMYRDLSL